MFDKKSMLRTLLVGALLVAGQPAMAADAKPAAAGVPTQAERDAMAREFFTDTEVIDQNGNKLRFYSDVLQDKVVLINVIFTNCQDACPMLTNHLLRTRRALAPAIEEDVWFVSLSTDPERDTPEAMKAFAAKQGADLDRWLFLTGTTKDMTFLLQKIRRYNPNIEAHSTQLLVGTTRERHEWIPLPPGLQPDAIAAVLRDLATKQPG
ncbi:MAG: SCO family protein [Gammaproteobacteria bacterium]|nr:SCO family protein [Gammaproteobacteria bacterium]